MFSIKKKKRKPANAGRRLGAIQLGPTRTRRTRKDRLRWWRDFRRSVYGYRPVFVVCACFVFVLLTYGAFVGGYVSHAGEQVSAAFDRQLMRAGIRIESVVLTGRKNCDIKSIKRVIALERADSMLNVNTKVIRKRLLDLGWVEQATVQRLLPNRININIVERKPYAVWQLHGSFSIIDASGTVIDGANTNAFSNLPLVVGKGANLHAQSLQNALAPYPEIRGRVKAAIRIGERRWNLRLASGVDVKLPEEPLDRSLRELSILETETRLLVRNIKALDLRFPDRLIIQTKDGALTEMSQASGKET